MSAGMCRVDKAVELEHVIDSAGEVEGPAQRLGNHADGGLAGTGRANQQRVAASLNPCQHLGQRRVCHVDLRRQPGHGIRG